MKITTTVITLSFLLLQGCSSFNQGKFNFGLEQRQNAVTGSQSNGLTPKLTYTSSFGGETQKPKAQDEMAMRLDKSDTETFVVIGAIALLLASKKSEAAPAKQLVCNTTTLPFPPYVATTCN